MPKIFTTLDKIKPAYDITYKVVLFICKILLILDGHTLGAIQAVITDNAWAKLTENQQAAIMEAGADTQKFNADLSESAENKVLDELKSSGCNVVDVPDKAPWQEACAKVISDNTSDQAELYQKLLDMKA